MNSFNSANDSNEFLFRRQAQENVDVFSQRWFYGGKLLGDKTTIEEAKVQPGYIIQVIINTEKQAAS
jgi:hypothetical protein